MENWEHQYKTVNGIKLHYVTAGKGPLLIMLHGFPEFWYSWRKQIPELSKHFTVVALDLRGFGDSDKPKGVKNYSSKVVSKDVKELIESLGFSKAHLVAHDWGGDTAWMFSQIYPQYLDKLVEINCPIPDVMIKHLKTNFTQLKKSWYMFLFQLPWLPERRLGKDLRLFFNLALRGWAKNKSAFSDEDIDQYVKAFEKPYALTAAINYYRAGFRTNLFDRKAFKPIATDTLVIWGENDRALGKELTYGMEKYFTGKFEIKYIPNCSHWVQHDYPDLVNRYILEFLVDS